MTRARLLGLVVALSLAAVAACGDDDTTFAPEPESKPVCMLLMGTFGYWEDGGSHQVSDLERGHVASACMCMTEDEFDSRSLHDDLNDLLLDECERQSALFEFDWDECQERHDSGHWIGATYWAWQNRWDFLVRPDLVCE